MNPEKPEKKNAGRPVDHLANERTFLAWIRTSLGIMAFGLVLEKFSYLMRGIDLFSGQLPVEAQVRTSSQSAMIFGLSFIVAGLLIGIFSFFNFKRVMKSIESENYRSSTSLAILLTLLVVVMGLFLVIFMR